MSRIVEAYIGEYASGKSENAVNRAIQLAKEGRKVTIVDLDLVEPFYTLRPIKKELMSLGIDVVAWETKETLGLGEAGSVIKPEMRWVLRRTGDLILDIGYGVEGAKTLNIIEGIEDEEAFKVIVVVNVSRPMTSSEEDIVEYLQSLGQVDGIVNNTHLGDETDLDVIQQGAKVVTSVANKLSTPVIATAVDEKFAADIGETDCMGNSIRVLHRYMPKTFW
ncbi:hypothetical protein GGQ84_002605 [Desulfitispora alkaliphila]|uniref:hypothetical protein n=1 Tax=Desulfitispora alkaliphila TaxID=622674 RepID=UPI003D1D777C